MQKEIENINIAADELLITPQALKSQLSISEASQSSVLQSRNDVRHILDRKDHRIIVVVGPCSIHDVDAAIEYANKLKALKEKLNDTIYLVMRVYFEKPRTSLGWKGLINDPYLDGTFKIEEGLRLGRKLMLDISSMGLPIATETLDPVSPQYLHDLVSWTAIGARTTESQIHREMASGLSSAVGFKNGTDGGLDVAINAMKSASAAHRFLGINASGQVSVLHTKGNQYGHVVLRGGNGLPNYSADLVKQCELALQAAGLAQNIMIDCSHENSNKDSEKQAQVIHDVAQQITQGNRSIIGLMIESNLNAGNQKIPDNLSELKYGVSITDACIDWQTTETLLQKLYDDLKDVLPKRLT